ncbi:MAG: hypothetical protein OXC30_03315 [Alphaproteobacteria bacterium]|nr:hypothetical protein [Alphaproteobacteria bacterium]
MFKLLLLLSINIYAEKFLWDEEASTQYSVNADYFQSILRGTVVGVGDEDEAIALENGDLNCNSLLLLFHKYNSQSKKNLEHAVKNMLDAQKKPPVGIEILHDSVDAHTLRFAEDAIGSLYLTYTNYSGQQDHVWIERKANMPVFSEYIKSKKRETSDDFPYTFVTEKFGYNVVRKKVAFAERGTSKFEVSRESTAFEVRRESTACCCTIL